MPIEYAIDHELQVLVLTASGTIILLERDNLVRRLLSDLTLSKLVPILIDLSEVTNIPEAEDTHKIAFVA